MIIAAFIVGWCVAMFFAHRYITGSWLHKW
jgi:hypothetical protein